MSLTIGVYTPEGIVLAADSRQSYRNMIGAARIGSDNATKIFQLGQHVAVTVAGPAFIEDQKQQPKLGTRSIGSYINEFLNQLTQKETVGSITTKLRAYLEGIYDPKRQLNKLVPEIKKQIMAQGGTVIKQTTEGHGQAIVIDWTDKDGNPQKGIAEVMPITLIVAGYDKQGDVYGLNAYNVYIPGPTEHIRQQGGANQFGANWTGQTDVVSRIVKGVDPRLNALDFMQATKESVAEEKIRQQLDGLEYSINWGAMTLFDAIDFARLMIETTTAIQKYSDGIKLMPGDMPGVGGQIDIAVIRPNDGFYWHQKKELNLKKGE